MAIVGIVLFAYAEGFKAATAGGIVLSVGAAVGAGLYKVCAPVDGFHLK